MLNLTIYLHQAESVAIEADDEEQAAADESDASDDEEAMEVETAASDVPMETDTTSGEKNAAAAEAKGPAAPKPMAVSIAVSSGLPQSKEELESLISAIHQTVNNSVLPRLNKCLTAKVRYSETHTVLICSESSKQKYNSGSACVSSR